MPNYNKVILMGNLTRDPELRYTPSGQAVADIRIAINRRTKTPDGERRDSVVFVDVTAWGKQAEAIKEYFSKGQPIFVEGRLSLDEWTGQDGQRRSKLRVVLENFQFVSPRDQSREPGSRAGEPPDDVPAGREPAPRESTQRPPAQRPPAERAAAAPHDRPSAPAMPPADEAEPFDDVPF